MSVNTYNSTTGVLTRVAGNGGGSFIYPHIYITAETGSTVTITDGTATITAIETSEGLFEADVVNLNTYTITVSLDGKEISQTLDVDTVKKYTVIMGSVPEGATVLPTDDIQTWLACANITNKSYTTLAEVLADRETFETLIADSNACDYMARSTTWAGSIEGQVPQMTDYTEPSGTVSASSEYDNRFPSWHAFNTSQAMGWAPASSDTGHPYIQYTFENPVIIDKVWTKGLSTGASSSVYHTILKASNDNFVSDTHDLGNVDISFSSEITTNVSNGNAYTSYRIYYDTKVSSGWTDGQGVKLQFYYAGLTGNQDAMSLIGKYDYCSNALLSNATWCEAIANSDYFEEVLNVKVPVMTGYTTPEGQVITSSEYGGDSISWKAFDNNTSTSWESQQGVTQASCGYIFTSPVAIKKVAILGNDPSSYYTFSPKDFNIEWSDDESTWTTDSTNFTYTVNQGSSALHNFFSPTLSGSHKGWRINVHNTWGANYLTVRTLQFYGRASAQTNIIHSAANDTIYMMDNGSPIIVATTNSDGDGILDFSSLEDKEYTFYSSVAKDPNNLSNDFSKTIRITNTPYGGTTELYLMPDAVKTLYWWGYVDGLETMSTANGWSGLSHLTLVNPTWNTNNVNCVTNANNYVQGIGTTNAKSLSNVKFHFIGTKSVSSNGIAVINTESSKAGVGGNQVSAIFNTADLPSSLGHVVSSSLTLNNEIIGVLALNASAQMVINAFWYE